MPETRCSDGSQGTDLRLIEETWQALQPFTSIEKCADCECLQASLTELVMALEAMPTNFEGATLLATIRNALDLSRLHGCLGCDPCEPADILAEFYRTRDTPEGSGRCGCGPSCSDGACTS